MSFETGSSQPSRLELLELDIDIRLGDLWRELGALSVHNNGSFSLEDIASYMRAAYGKAYCDVLSEHPSERGSLCTDHGYKTPLPRPLPLDEALKGK